MLDAEFVFMRDIAFLCTFALSLFQFQISDFKL